MVYLYVELYALFKVCIRCCIDVLTVSINMAVARNLCVCVGGGGGGGASQRCAGDASL